MSAVVQQEPENDRPAWARWLTIGSLFIAAIALFFTVRHVGVHELMRRLGKIGPWFGLILAMEMVVTGFDSFGLQSFLRAGGRYVTWPRALLAHVAGKAINIVTPSGSLGDVVKFSMLVEQRDKTSAAAAVLSYNLSHAGVELFRLGIGAPIGALVLPLPMKFRIALMVAGFTALLLVLLMVVWIRAGLAVSAVRFARSLRLVSAARVEKWRVTLERIDITLAGKTQEARYFQRRGFFAIVGSNLPGIVTTAVLLHALGLPLTLGNVAVIVAVAPAIGWISSVVPFGIGVSEALNLALFAALGLSPADGVTLAIAKRSMQLVYAAIGLTLTITSESVREARRAKFNNALLTAPVSTVTPLVQPRESAERTTTSEI
jgi:uncharacterized membrane protein YbhN (UPF0104 family)